LRRRVRAGDFPRPVPFENEQFLEAINRTAHAAALTALVETTNTYRFYFGIYVRDVGGLFHRLHSARELEPNDRCGLAPFAAQNTDERTDEREEQITARGDRNRTKADLSDYYCWRRDCFLIADNSGVDGDKRVCEDSSRLACEKTRARL
jgi:hypothetical protein